MKFFISFSEDLGRILDKEYFKKSILLKWPDIIIEEIRNPERDFNLEWEFKHNQDYLTGKLSRDEDFVVFEFSSLQIGADFALWLYKNVIRKNSVILYDADYSAVVPLNGATNENDIIQSFS